MISANYNQEQTTYTSLVRKANAINGRREVSEYLTQYFRFNGDESDSNFSNFHLEEMAFL